MTQMKTDSDWTLFIAVIPTVVLGIWIRYLVRMGVAISMLISLGINIGVAVYLSSVESNQGDWTSVHQRLNSDDGPLFVAAILVTANLAAALLIKRYRAAVLDKTTPAERLPGTAGVRAWLSPLNVITVICLTIAANLAFGYSYVGTAFMGFCLLLGYPLFNTLIQQPASVMPPPQAPAEERQRVLALVEAGKITAEDAAELMSALAQSQVASVEASSVISGPRRVMIGGAVLVLVGFFMPWFTINVTQAMRDAMSNVQQNMPQFPGMPAGDGSINVPVQNVMQTTLHGGDVRNGLGWIALAVAVGAAGLPFFWTLRSERTGLLRNSTLAALVAGSVAMLYLLSDHFNSVTTIEPGFMLAMAGYVVSWVGAIREYVVHRPGMPVAMTATM